VDVYFDIAGQGNAGRFKSPGIWHGSRLASPRACLHGPGGTSRRKRREARDFAGGNRPNCLAGSGTREGNRRRRPARPLGRAPVADDMSPLNRTSSGSEDEP
jgi:hypothetical protein